MGLVKILILTVGPVTGLLYWTFKLGKQLPTASRLMGNYIGLSYIYLKVGLKALKPANDLGVEILDIVRKTSQQTKALQRQLRTAAKDITNEAKRTAGVQLDEPPTSPQSKPTQPPLNTLTGSALIAQVFAQRNRLAKQQKQRAASNRFYDNL